MFDSENDELYACDIDDMCPHPVHIECNIISMVGYLDRHVKWHRKNAEWLQDRQYMYMIDRDSTILENRRIIYTYYFQNKNDGLLFSLWCPRKV